MEKRQSGFPKKFLILLATSLWGPLIWIAVTVAEHEAFKGRLFTTFLGGNLIAPAITLWIASGTINLSLYGIALRLGETPTMLFIIVSVPIPAFIILIFALMAPSPYRGWTQDSFTLDPLPVFNSVMLAIFVAAFSVPAWITLAIKGPKPLDPNSLN